MEASEFTTQYVFGRGSVGVASGSLQGNESVVGIELSHLSKEFEVGEYLEGKEYKQENVSRLIFTNLESLEVLQLHLNSCRELLLKSINQE